VGEYAEYSDGRDVMLFESSQLTFKTGQNANSEKPL